MKFIPFDLTSVPMMQGEAIKAIVKDIRGKLVEAGEVAPGEMPEELDGNFLYLKTQSANTAISVWHDDGCGVACRFLKIDDEPWRERFGPNDWRATDFTLETITLEEWRREQRLVA